MTDEAPKRPSGAQQRKRAYAAESDAARQDAKSDDGLWAAGFEAAGGPDLENPDTDLSYVRKLQMIVLQQMATTPFPTKAQEQCWRRVREMSAVCGMTSNRASLEAKVKKLSKALAERELPVSARVERGASIAKPPTARGGVRGPRPVDGDPTVS